MDSEDCSGFGEDGGENSGDYGGDDEADGGESIDYVLYCGSQERIGSLLQACFFTFSLLPEIIMDICGA